MEGHVRSCDGWAFGWLELGNYQWAVWVIGWMISQLCGVSSWLCGRLIWGIDSSMGHSTATFT